MAIQFQSLLERFGLLHQVIAFINDEDINLIVMVIAKHSIIDCEPLKVLKVYESICFKHVTSKAY